MMENQGNQYGNQNPNGYAAQPGEKGEGTAFGIASMVLGIVSLLLFCTCVNWITGILAIIFGILQLVKHKEKGFAIAGIITAGISLLLAIMLYVSLAAGMSGMGMEYDEFFEEYFGTQDGYDDYYDAFDNYYGDYYDTYDNYYDDYYDDYYDGYYDGYYDDYNSYFGESGPEFL